MGSIQGVPAARLERRIPSAPLQFDLIKFTSSARERIHYQCSQQTKQIDYFDKTQSSQGGHTHTLAEAQRQQKLAANLSQILF